MDIPFEPTLREHLADYLAGRVSLDGFKDWLVGATWDIDEHGERDAVALTYDVKLALADHSSGYLTEDELRRELRLLAAAPAGAA